MVIWHAGYRHVPQAKPFQAPLLYQEDGNIVHISRTYKSTYYEPFASNVVLQQQRYWFPYLPKGSRKSTAASNTWLLLVWPDATCPAQRGHRRE